MEGLTMADVFLSYKREDVHRAKPLVEALEDDGWTVFWDPQILSGDLWEAVLKKELDAASCVVVLWSRRSVQSEWVLREARTGLARGVLIPVLVEDVELPEEFRRVQATNLASWHGARDAPALQQLLRVIHELIGRTLWPVDFNLITGDKTQWTDLGATVNVGCRLTNHGSQPLTLTQLALTVFREGELIYDLGMHLFYSAEGLEHVKDIERRIDVAGRSEWEKGVQFRGRADTPNIWPVGSYEFDLLAWVNCRPASSRANVRTTFRSDVDRRTFLDLARWRGATPDEWTRLNASNRALGLPIPIIDVKARLKPRP
jgi:hypothetical protein